MPSLEVNRDRIVKQGHNEITNHYVETGHRLWHSASNRVMFYGVKTFKVGNE
jgi:hypothetical protein